MGEVNEKMNNLKNCNDCGAKKEVEVMEREEKEFVCVYAKCRVCSKETIVRRIPMEEYEAQHYGRSSIEGGWRR